MGDGKQIIDILLPTLQNKFQVQAAQVFTALCTKSQAMQTPLTLYDNPASTWTITDKGPNMPGQDVPNISSEPGEILFLIAKLSS